MATFIETKKRQKKLVWVLLVVVLITIIVLWQGFFKKPEQEIELVDPERVISETREVKIDFQILEDPIFEKLQPFEKIKPFEGTSGREIPFLPY